MIRQKQHQRHLEQPFPRHSTLVQAQQTVHSTPTRRGVAGHEEHRLELHVALRLEVGVGQRGVPLVLGQGLQNKWQQAGFIKLNSGPTVLS